MKGIRGSEKLVYSVNDQIPVTEVFCTIPCVVEDVVRITVYIMFELYLYFSESISPLFKVGLSF